MTFLTGWENFFVIIGSAAAVLIGLQFVVISLIAIKPIKKSEAESGQSFSTPNVFHFGAILLFSVIGSVPWTGSSYPAILWTLLGICGFVYAIITARRISMQKIYHPLLYDWFFHVILPTITYAVLAISAFETLVYPGAALFFVTGAAVALLLIAIHNTWDAVTYLVFVRFIKD